MKLFLSSPSNRGPPHKLKANILLSKIIYCSCQKDEWWTSKLLCKRIHYNFYETKFIDYYVILLRLMLFILFRAKKLVQISAWISYTIYIFVYVIYFLLTKLFVVLLRLALLSWLIPDHQQTVCMDSSIYLLFTIHRIDHYLEINRKHWALNGSFFVPGWKKFDCNQTSVLWFYFTVCSTFVHRT